MKINKVIFSLMLVAACANPLCTSAKDGDYNGLSDEGETYIRSEEYQNRKEKKAEWVEEQSKVSLFRSAGRLGVPHYTQDTDKWCGPTAMKMVVEYVTGDVYSQSYLAGILGSGSHGTYVDVLAIELASYTGLAYELGITSDGNFYKNVKADFDAGYPVIYDVDASVLDDYYLEFTPHFIVGEGYSSSGDLYYSDPGKNNEYSRSASQSKMIEALDGNDGYYIY